MSPQESPITLKVVPGFTNIDKPADPPQKCHYGDPYKQACQSDEVSARIQAHPRDLEICVSKCDSDDDCPTDTCPGVVAKPRCFLQDATGQKYCGLPCSKGAVSCSTDEHMVCQKVSGITGICGYAS